MTLIIANVDKLAPIISMEGVVTSISWAVLATAFGIFSRRNFQEARIRIEMGSDISGGIVDLMTKYDDEKGPLMKQRAAQLRVAEPDQLDLNRAAEIVNDLLPLTARLLFAWSMRRTKDAPHPQLVNEAAAVRLTFSQQFNYNAMIVLTNLVIVNLLCFLAKPRWFEWLLRPYCSDVAPLTAHDESTGHPCFRFIEINGYASDDNSGARYRVIDITFHPSTVKGPAVIWGQGQSAEEAIWKIRV